MISTLYSCANNQKEYILPERNTITESVYASASIMPKDLLEVRAVTSGIIERIYVSERDSVAKGQPIAKLKGETSAILRDNARLQSNLASEKLYGKSNLLLTIDDEIATVRAQTQIDSLNYHRQLRLWAQQIGSQVDLENRQLKFDQSSKRLSSLESQWLQTKIDLENGALRSSNELKKAEQTLDDFTIRSPQNGKVYSIIKSEGELLTAQSPIAQIGHASEFVIEMLIDEVDIISIDLGMVVYISLDAYPASIFSARLSQIYPLKDLRTQTFKVEAIFDDPPAKLFAGLSGEANIVVSRKENALTVPASYIGNGGSIFLSSGESVYVEIGIRNNDLVEIRSGLDPDAIIIKPWPHD